jgi:hypothetical protein
MPAPLSVTAKVIMSSSCRAVSRMRPQGWREVDRVAQEVAEHPLDRVFIGEHQRHWRDLSVELNRHVGGRLRSAIASRVSAAS